MRLDEQERAFVRAALAPEADRELFQILADYLLDRQLGEAAKAFRELAKPYWVHPRQFDRESWKQWLEWVLAHLDEIEKMKLRKSGRIDQDGMSQQ